MEPHVMILLLLGFALIFAIAKQLLYIAVLVVIVAFAYYTGMAEAFFEIVMPYVTPYLPEVAETAEVAMILPKWF